jgi:hypothetical protein
VACALTAAALPLVAACSSEEDAGATSGSADASARGTGGSTVGSGGTGSGGKHTSDGGTGGATVTDASARDARGAVDASGSDAADADAPRDAADADAGRRNRYLWQLPYGRSFAAHVAVDSTGAAIVSGTFFEAHPITLGATTLTSKGSADVMLSRVLPTGTIDWARSFGAAAEDYPVSFVVDPTDRITLTGLYNGAGNVGGPDLPTFAGTPGRYDVYVAGLSARGDYRWQATINTTMDCFPGPGIALASASNVFVVGNFMGTATIGGAQHVSSGSWDAYFTRFDLETGSLGAALVFGGTGDDRAIAAVAAPGDVVVFGTFHDQVTFPTSPPTVLTSAGGADVFVARVSSSGVMSRVVSFGGPGDEIIEEARGDSDGSIVIAGDFTSTSLSIFGGRNLSNHGGYDFFVGRLDPDLSEHWSESFGGSGDDRVRDMALGPGGEIAIAGEYRDTIGFGSDLHVATPPGDGGPAEIDIFLAKLSNDGAPEWSVSAGGPDQDRGLGVAVDASSSVFLTASFRSPVDFGGGEVLTPEKDQWASALVKFAP